MYDSFLDSSLFSVFFLALLRKILVENPLKRANLEDIQKHHWYKKNFNKEKGKIKERAERLIKIYYFHCIETFKMKKQK